MNTREKLAALRGIMEERGLAAWLVPSTDPHQSEYVPECWQRRQWLSGFTGSAGDLLVTRGEAGLWTDGRYFLQAEQQLRGSGIRLFKMGERGVPTLLEFIAKALHQGEKIGADSRVHSVESARRIAEAAAKAGAEAAFLEDNLVDRIWSDRPEPSDAPIRIQEEVYAGESVRSKLTRVRKEMKAREAEALVVPVLDAIAWLYNIRGRDAVYNPVAIAYALVTPKDALLFIREDKVPRDAARKLGSSVQVRPYDDFAATLRELGGRKARVWIDGDTASRWIADCLDGADLVTVQSPIVLMKARKNPVEIAGMRAAHVRDGVAMVRFLRWLEEEVPKGELTEISAAQRLDEFRAAGEFFQGPSFDSISGYGAHGAIVHYRVTEKTDVPLRPEGIYLIDSGGQYLDGTTDITRTVLLGRKATKEQKERHTRVLKGHIALARAKFPAGTRGIRLDTLARTALWDAGLDYNHGTGHGVGAYLNVHEGPQSISWSRDTGAALEPGNILSNEPGYYEEGAYGLRIENLVLVAEDAALSREGHQFLCFETLTLCPIDNRLIDGRLLGPEERQWLNAYHRRVERTLGPLVDLEDRKWLRKACAPV